MWGFDRGAGRWTFGPFLFGAGARDRTRALVLSFHTCTFTRKPQPELMEKILAKGHFGQFGGMEVS